MPIAPYLSAVAGAVTAQSSRRSWDGQVLLATFRLSQCWNSMLTGIIPGGTLQHVRDVIQGKAKTELAATWRWRPELPLANGLEEGPSGPRTMAKQERATAKDLATAGPDSTEL
jgi:hypothetical protein